MKSWESDLLLSAEGIECEHAMFQVIEGAVHALGFECCAFSMRIAFPLTSRKTIVLNRGAAPWWLKEINSREFLFGTTLPDALYLRSVPPLARIEHIVGSVTHPQQATTPTGISINWTQSSFRALGFAGMLTARSTNVEADKPVTAHTNARSLANIAHQTLHHLFSAKLKRQIGLSSREVDVLRWTADGKSSGDISHILTISQNTVNFHIKNAVAKLQTTNKTAAAVRAATLGLLN